MRLVDKVIVVTGAALGMGQAMARLFASEGAKVVAGDVNAQALEALTSEVTASGGIITGVHGNVAVRRDAEALVITAIDKYGRIDGLVNNAGIVDRFQPVGSLEDEVWERVLGVNLNGPMYTTRRAVQFMLEGSGGSIVNISSFAGASGAVSGVAYAVSKHGLVGLTRNTAWMYLQKGIRCNAIMPGGGRNKPGLDAGA